MLNLEEVAGVPLFDRRGSALALTDAGRELLEQITPAFDRLLMGMNAIRGEKRGGALRIAMPPSFAFRWASPIIEACRVESKVRVEIETPYEQGDLDHTIHDVAVVFSRPKATSTIMDLLWMEELTLLCSPSLATGGKTRDLRQMIADQPILHVRNAGGRHSAWSQFLREAGVEADVSEGLVFDTAHLALDFVMREGGLLVADRRLCREDLERGDLMAPFDIVAESGFGYFMLFRPEDMQREAVQVFRRQMIAQFAGDGCGEA